MATSTAPTIRTRFGGLHLDPSQRQSLVIIGLLLALLLTVTLVAVVAERDAVDRLRRDGASQLNLFVSNMRSELDKFAFLPEILARNERLINLLLDPENDAKVGSVNRYLERVNTVAAAADTYLMDRQGLTLAASNWASERPFVGVNFSYRPYFQAAIQGRPGRYYALGTTSNVRGYYYAHPVERADQVLGVIVVKVDLERIESAWSRASQRIVVTDRHGVIFITNHPPWRLRTMRPLPADVRARIRESRQYGDSELLPLEVISEQPRGEGSKFLTVRAPTAYGAASREPRDARYLVQSTQLDREQWIVHMLTNTASIAGEVLIAILLATVIFAVLVLSGVFLLQRRRNLRQQLLHQQQVEATLQAARAELEARVRERTADLLRTNRELDREIASHKQSEANLRQAQSDLIQAAKLAVIGQMSAGITHELNQPLAAIKSYADNARVFLQREATGQVEDNLAIISELTDRMAQITGHLKTFARKSDNRIEPVDFTQALDNALVLLAPRMRKQGVALHSDTDTGPVLVRADVVRIEQVLVNLIKNAIDAMQECGGTDLYLALARANGWLEFRVRDTGRGIDPAHLSQLFDPFFTTKDVGEGLGLGLSISYGIVKDFGGRLSARNHPAGGAEFKLTLPLADEPD